MRHVRVGLLDDRERRLDLHRDALEHAEAADHRDVVRRQRERVLVHDVAEAVDDVLEVELGDRRVEHVRQRLAERRGDRRDVLGGRDEAHPLVQLGQRAEVAVDEVDDGLDDRVALRRREEGHHPKVDVREAAVGPHEQVAHVRVGVEEAALQHLPQRALHERVDDVAPLEAVLAQRRAVSQPEAIDPLHRQHAARRERREDLGRRDVGDGAVEPREPRRVGGLDAVVDLGVDELAKVVDDRDEIDVAAERRDQPRQRRRVGAQDVQVERDDRLAAGPLHLDRHLPAVEERRLVDLPERRRRHRLARDLRVDLRDRHAELGLEDRERGVVGKRRHAVLQPLQLGEVLGGQQVGARREGLSRLDDGGAEARDQRRQLGGALLAVQLLPAALHVEHDLADERGDRRHELQLPQPHETPPALEARRRRLGRVRRRGAHVGRRDFAAVVGGRAALVVVVGGGGP